MNVLKIVETWLRQHNFDGLVEPDGECACKLGHLAPCGQIGHGCIPGHLAPCPPECGEGCEFHIVGNQSGWEVEGHSEWSTLNHHNENNCEVCDSPLSENSEYGICDNCIKVLRESMAQPPVRRLGEEEQ